VLLMFQQSAARADASWS